MRRGRKVGSVININSQLIIVASLYSPGMGNVLIDKAAFYKVSEVLEFIFYLW